LSNNFICFPWTLKVMVVHNARKMAGGDLKESSLNRGRKRGRNTAMSVSSSTAGSSTSSTSSVLEDEVDLPDSLIKDIFEDEEIQMSAGDLLDIGDEELDEYDESSDGDCCDGQSSNGTGGEGSSVAGSFSPYDQDMMTIMKNSSEEGSQSSSSRGKRRYNRSDLRSQSNPLGLGNGSSLVGSGGGPGAVDLLEDAGGNGSEASDKSGKGGCGKRKQVLSARERNLRRLESNERERQRMHSLNDAFQVSYSILVLQEFS